MRHTRVARIILLALLSLLFIAGCGGGHKSSNTIGPVAKVALTPNPVSINAGDVVQLQISATDAAGHSVLNQTPTFSANNGITVANNGQLCGGAWDSLTTPIVCTPVAVGAAGVQSTVTATVQGIASNAITVFVHLPITSLTVTPSGFSSTTCNVTLPAGAGAATGVQQSATVTYTAQAFNNGADITASVGAFNWSISDTTIGTLAAAFTTTTTNTATAKLPGAAQVFASANNVNIANSQPANFVECPVATITITPAPINFSATGNTQQVSATLTDSTGAAVTGETLGWNTSQAAVVSIAATGIATAVSPGRAALTASCTPNTCNKNLGTPAYSNTAVATVPGTSSTTVYVAGKASTSLIPITTSNNTAGTAIALPQLPNSLLFSPNGGQAFLGSSAGMMIVNATSNTVANTITNMPGTVLAVSPDSSSVLVSNPASSQVFLLNQNGSSVTGYAIPNATAADFTPDSLRAYVVSGSTVFVLQSGLTTSKQIALGASATSVSMLANGSAAFVGASGTPFISTCNNVLSAGPGGSPTLVLTLPDGSQMLGADSPNLDLIPVSITGATGSCPPAASAPTTANLGSAYTPQQINVTSDGQQVYVTSNVGGQLLHFNIAGNNATPITLSSSATTFTGGATPDSATVYVGASDSQVHRIDVASGTDAQQFPIGFVPDLVAVRP